MCLAASGAELPSRMNSGCGDPLCLEWDFTSLLSPDDFQMASALNGEFASGVNHGIYRLVVMTRVMVEQQECVNLCFECERNGARDRTMSPPDVRLIFLIGVLRIEDQNVGAAQKLN